jgi:hypothetical protein
MEAPIDLVTDWASFHKRLQDPVLSRVSCRLGGELFPYHVPPIDPLALLDDARKHPQSRILSQKPGVKLDDTAVDAERVRRISIEEAAALPNLHISLFDLVPLFEKGRSLARLNDEVIKPMEALWHGEGIRSEKFWPVLFITGSASATNYHIDPMPTLPLNLFGRKQFFGLKDPERWCPPEMQKEILSSGKWPTKPGEITADDCVTHTNAPGDLVWIPVGTPHWVDAGSFSATLTFTFPKMWVESPVVSV